MSEFPRQPIQPADVITQRDLGIPALLGDDAYWAAFLRIKRHHAPRHEVLAVEEPGRCEEPAESQGVRLGP